MGIAQIAHIDLIFIGILVVFVVRCAFRGFVSEFMSMAALVIGLLFAIFFFRRAAVLIGGQFSSESTLLTEIISFAMLFLIAFIAVRILETFLKSIVTKIKLTGVDRLLGVAYGFLEGLIVVYLIIFIINIQPFFDSGSILGNSIIAEKLMQFITGYREGPPNVV